MESQSIKKPAEDCYSHNRLRILSALSSNDLGAAFTNEERDTLGLRGLLPARVESLSDQAARVIKHLESLGGHDFDLAKHQYLAQLREHHRTLFYYVTCNYLKKIMPLIYTPTVGEACEKGQAYGTGAAMYISKDDKGKIRRILDNWLQPDVSIIVVTDGSRILGLGDLGINGMGIPVGKLSLYIAAGGFDPLRTLPVTVDLGTNNKDLLENPKYMGIKEKRVSDEEFYDFMDEFCKAVKDKWPNCLVQFEDFSSNHAFELLARQRNELLSFNDDIQGTGAVVAAGFLNAVKMSGTAMKDQRIVLVGAGSGGIGVANACVAEMLYADKDLSKEDAKKRVWTVDSKGLVTTNRGDKLDEHKKAYARDDCEEQIKELIDIIKKVKPTALFGLVGTNGGVFTKEIIQTMAELNDKPIIFALSNPTSKAECTAEEAYKHSGGKVIYASGSPFDTVKIEGKKYYPGQGNNMYIFPGVGFGAVLCKSKTVTEEMLSASARALAKTVNEEEQKHGLIYPKIDRIREISCAVAVAVMETAYEQGVAQADKPEDFAALVKKAVYEPAKTSFKDEL